MLKFVALTSIAFAALAFAATPALAKPGFSGFAGVGGQTCGVCHGGGTVPTVAFKVAPASLMRGQTGTYTFGVTGSLARTTMDIAALDANGANVPLTGDGTSTQTFGNEVIPVGNFFAGAAKDYTFRLTPPAGAASPITIYAVGMATNGSGTGGDGVGKTTFAVALSGTVTADAGAPDGGGRDGGSSGSSGSTSGGASSGGTSSGGASSSSGGASSGGASSGGASSGGTSSGTADPMLEADDGSGGCTTGRTGPLGLGAPFGALLAISAVLRRLAKRRAGS